MEENDNQKGRKRTAQKAGGLLFVGCLFIGMAVGSYYDNMRIGLFAGMGIGFLMMAVVILSSSDKK